MTTSRRIAGNTLIQLISKAITAATSVLVIAYLTRYLGVSGYGDYATIFAYLGVFGVFVDLGIFVTSVREIAKDPAQERTIIGNVLGLRLVVGITVFTIACLTAFLIPYSPLVRLGIALGAVSQLFLVLNQAPISLFQARLIMHRAAISDVVGRLALLALVWWFISLHLGFLPIIGAVAISSFVTFLASMVLALSVNAIWPRFERKIWRQIFWSALPMGVVIILGTVYFRIDTVILSLMKGSFDVGVYGAPYKVLEVLLAIPSIFMSSVLPVMTRALGESRAHALGIFHRAFDFMGLAALPLITGTALLATPIMVLLAGQEFVLSGPVLRVLIFAIGGSFLNSVMIYTMIAAGEQRRLMFPYILAVAFNVIANLLIIPSYTYMGAAVITVLTELWVLVASAYLVRRFLRFTPAWGVFGKAVVASLVMGIVVWYCRGEGLWLRIGLGAVTYGAALLLTKAVRLRDIYELLPKFGRS